MQVDVGQLLFVLDTKSHSIIPAQVDEVIVSKTVKGETVQHKLAFPNGKKAVLEKMSAPWFVEIADAKSFLLSEAEKMIDKVVQNATVTAEKYFDSRTHVNQIEDVYQSPDQLIPTTNDSDQLTVDLGDGRKAKVHLPKEFKIENTAG